MHRQKYRPRQREERTAKEGERDRQSEIGKPTVSQTGRQAGRCETGCPAKFTTVLAFSDARTLPRVHKHIAHTHTHHQSLQTGPVIVTGGKARCRFCLITHAHFVGPLVCPSVCRPVGHPAIRPLRLRRRDRDSLGQSGYEMARLGRQDRYGLAEVHEPAKRDGQASEASEIRPH
ncbi:unnamed protein product [Protopolystoma xenopodis]|uniref:Uncharacterized protein n=1 Tax=Protopolystoma xenopodis TaxID=117903 RepID=A0A3S5AW77_9PLAT|nr:unnamed protein product [Protopolystoma xenopodis]